MQNNTLELCPNDEYNLMASEVTKVRDCELGQFFVKRKGVTYLAHPNEIDPNSSQQQARYNKYKQNASFVEIPKQTKKSILGKVNTSDMTVELPDQLDYLLADSNRDGQTLEQLAESVAGEQLSVKWTLLVSDYDGLTDVDTAALSVADLEALNPRATINQYTRENVIDWAFSRANGRMQLMYVLLRETSEEIDYNNTTASNARDEVVSYLKLALDEEGNYYQQKIVSGADQKGYQEGERYYPTVNGAMLAFLPVTIISDDALSTPELPLELGYLSGICDLTLDRYRNDAEYKEVMENLKATTYIEGVSRDFMEAFKECNGRDYVAIGDTNVLPGSGVSEPKVNVVSANDHTGAFERFKTQNEKEIRALGGVFPSDELKQRTATETVVEAANLTSMLNPMVNALEHGLSEAIAYCAMFEGMVTPDDVMIWQDENITITLPREFATQRMSVEERKQLAEEFLSGAITKDTYMKLLDEGGVIPDWEEELKALENQGPLVV